MKFNLIIDKNANEEVTVIAHEPSKLTQQIEDLVMKYSGKCSIIGNKDDEMRKLNFDEIECITVVSRKLIAIDKGANQYRIGGTLREIEEILPSYFIRINKSTIANENCILKFNAGFGGGVDAIFKCGYREYVSRRCFAEIKRRFEKL